MEQDGPRLLPLVAAIGNTPFFVAGHAQAQAAQAAEPTPVALALAAPGAVAAPMAAVVAEDVTMLSHNVRDVVFKDALPALLLLPNPSCTIPFGSEVGDIATALHAWADVGGHNATLIRNVEVIAADEALEVMDLEQELHPLLQYLPHLLYMKILTPSPPPPSAQPPNYDGLYLHNSLPYAPLEKLTSRVVQVRTFSQ